MIRSAFSPRLGLLVLILALASCSSSEDTPNDPPPAPKIPEAIGDLTVTAGSASSVTLAWTSPELADKLNIQYDLRYIAYGAEGAPWDSWTVAAPPTADAAAGQARTFEVTGLSANGTYAFRMTSSSDGTDWSAASNTVVATAAPDFDTTAPAAVTRLSRLKSSTSSLTMIWPFAGDDGAYGQASGYQARFAATPITPETWDSATPVPGPIFESTIPGVMETEIIGLTADQEYFVAVVAIDDVSNSSAISNVVSAMTKDTSTIYVNVEGTGDYPTIEEAVEAAVIGSVVLVGPGRYTWANQATGDSLLGMINVPRYYEGADYYDFEVRSIAGPEATILDAQLHGKVMSVTGGTSGGSGNLEYAGITIDGFTFTNGRALATGPNELEGWSGAGLNLHLTDTVVRNCIFTGNRAFEGGALWVGGQGDALIENCLFENNEAVNTGGAIMLINSWPRITVRDCVLRGNQATRAGGGIFAYSVLATLENLLIVGNKSSDKGGGISVSNIHEGTQMFGCTVADNHAGWGSAIRLADNSIFQIYDSVLAFNTGSPAFSSVVQSQAVVGCTLIYGHDQGNQLPYGAVDEGGNLETDPLFCNRVTYELQMDSPCMGGHHPDQSDCGLMGARGVGCGQ